MFQSPAHFIVTQMLSVPRPCIVSVPTVAVAVRTGPQAQQGLCLDVVTQLGSVALQEFHCRLHTHRPLCCTVTNHMTDHMTHEGGRWTEKRFSIGRLGCPGIDLEAGIVDGQLEGNLGHRHLGEQLISCCHL